MRESADAEKLTVSINDRDSVTALLYLAAKKDRAGITLLLAHGAGANQLSSFMRMFASGMAGRGFDAMTFNFLYAEQGRRAPDPKAKLEFCYRSVIQASLGLKKLKRNHLVIGGKSMGGRIASQVAAEDASKISGVVFLGYPLHPPGKPEQLRDAHLKAIRTPMLFVQGSRDAFGTPDELRAVINRDRLPATFCEIEGGDHSFKVPKSAALSQEEVYEMIMDKTAGWARSKLARTARSS
jgi:predicted alpha/beta-hydrolase family hydrolase